MKTVSSYLLLARPCAGGKFVTLKRRISAVVLVMLSVSVSAANTGLEAAVKESPDPYAHETPEQRNERLTWFNDARFGMFIHWGVYSVPAGKYKGREIPSDSCFITERTKMPLTDYHAFAAKFNPTQYDPDAWVRLARDAGMKYIVITTKHHDGFALFDTKASEWDMVDATPYGKDVIAPLAEACRKYGMKLGFYYSQCEDWGNPGGRVRKGKWDPLQEGEFMDYIHNIAVPQVKELLTNYGDVSVFWWDTPTKMTQEASDALIQQLKLQPGIIHNNRLGFYPGDLRTPEQHIPSAEEGYAWEACMTIRDTWGFKLSDTNFKSTKTLIHNLVDIASKGGNYLLNVGPTAEGLIPATSQERLCGIGAWMKVNGESIYGTQASLFARPAWGRVTRKSVPEGTILYLHVFDWKKDGTLFVPVGNEVLSCALLNDREQTFDVERNAEGLTVTMKGAAPNPIASVIELRLKGEQVLTGENMIRQQENGTVFLGAEQASFGGGGRMGIDHNHRSIHGWKNQKAWVSWSFTLQQAGTYRIELDAATEGETACTITVDGLKVPVALPKTKDLYDFEKMSAGQVDLEHPGEVTLRIDPVPGKWKKVNLRSVRLLPIGEMNPAFVKESLEAYNARMQWFVDAQYGMFIHFGLYSQLGGEWKGQQVKGYAEWIQSKAKIPRDEYPELLKTFNPARFDADLIVSTARQAGMKYLVITSKHHEGFCLWDSKYTDYDVASTPFKGRDILDELNQACRKQGLKFGLYYSILDWHHPAHSGLTRNTQVVPGRGQEYIDYQKNQVLELIERYDPAVLWFDGDWVKWWTMPDGIDLYNTIRAASSKVIVNNRVAKRQSFELDYVTKEQNHFSSAFPKHWEACYTMNKSWGYKKGDDNWKDAETVYDKLKDVNVKGGNLLLNVGPDGNGVVQQEAISILLETGKMIEAEPITKKIPKIIKLPGIKTGKKK